MSLVDLHDLFVQSVSVKNEVKLMLAYLDGSCLVHSNSGELLHKLVPSFQWVHPHMIDIMRDGRIVVHYADQKGCLAIFSCNERQLCHCQLGDPALVSEKCVIDTYTAIIMFSNTSCRL